ncbi:MAG: sodium:proton antiporter [Bacteroides sp.]|nr:sodium:proton antiporter [Bacteroides sp.]
MPLLVLLGSIAGIIAVDGASAVQDYSYIILGCAAVVCILLAATFTRLRSRSLHIGIIRSARQILPAIPILALIGTVSATWMLSGVVPTLIDYGLEILDSRSLLAVACFICSVVSVATGSSWTTIATIGVALMSIGSVMGYSEGWIAGAIISGAYFGDKVSPLSDTTVLAASTCGVPLLRHIRYLMLTSAPAMAIAMIVFLCVGYFSAPEGVSHSREMVDALHSAFNITPLTLIIPAITLSMIALRFNTTVTLAVGSLAGLIGIFVFQPHVFEALAGADSSFLDRISTAVTILTSDTALSTGSDLLDPLVSTGGIKGMLPTIWLVLAAMLFGGAMIGTGMLGRITSTITSRLRRTRSIVGTTVCSGLFLNSCTGDQYMSIIIGANVFRNTYRRRRLKPQTLSRTLEDSISVTSVLIPWNSCGVTQSTVLGVATLTYLPFCIFNILSPVMTMIMAVAGWRVRATTSATVAPASSPAS